MFTTLREVCFNFSFTKPEFILNYFGGSARDYVEFVEGAMEPEEGKQSKEFTAMLIDSEEDQ